MNTMLRACALELSGLVCVNKWGRNEDIDQAALEDLWSGGGDYPWPTVSQKHDVASSSANDTAAGSGARTVSIRGLDANYDIISETVTLNGASNVETVNSYLRINRLQVLTAGASEQAEGDITVTGQTDSTITSRIDAGESNQDRIAAYTVPRSYLGILYNVFASINKPVASTNTITYIFGREPGSVFQVKGAFASQSDGNGILERAYQVPLHFEEKTDVKLRVEVTSNNVDVAGGFELVIVPQSEIDRAQGFI